MRMDNSNHEPIFNRPSSAWHNRRLQRVYFVAIALFLFLGVIYGHRATRTNWQLDPESRPAHTSPVQLDPTRVALLIETRPLPRLPAILSHFIFVLPPAWTFRFVGSPEAVKLLSSASSLSAHINNGKLSLGVVPPDYGVESQESLSMTLTNLSFYADFLHPAEWLLLFQTDSMVCAASEQSLDDYVEKGYTWVGAPWYIDNDFGGNGGLSLRHIPPIVKLLRSETRKPGDEAWEDRWLCDRLGKMPGVNMPPPEITKRFSVESVWDDRPLGYHLKGSGKYMDPRIWADESRRAKIFQYCPEVSLVLDVELASHKNESEKLNKQTSNSTT